MGILLSKNVTDSIRDKRVLHSFKTSFMNRIFLYYLYNKSLKAS